MQYAPVIARKTMTGLTGIGSNTLKSSQIQFHVKRASPHAGAVKNIGRIYTPQSDMSNKKRLDSRGVFYFQFNSRLLNAPDKTPVFQRGDLQ
ncbi:MAG: hypothetical protein V4805_12255 [Pseudomonadota bacterium]